MANRVLLIDAFNVIRRIFEARGATDLPAVIDASTRSLQRAVKQHNPSHGVVVFDSHDKTWRHLLYSEYKAGRSPTPPLLLDNIPAFIEAFEQIGLSSLLLESYEADDVIATLAVGVADNGGEARILSTDKMFYQLLRPGIRIFNHFDDIELTIADVKERFGLEISQLTDYWALSGDNSNNIKGIPKIGKKTATNLIQQYGTLEEVLRTEDIAGPVERVQKEGDLAQRCKQLVTLNTNVDLGINLKSFRLKASV